MLHTILRQTNEEYPSLLRELAQPPKVLYCVGDATLLHSPCIAIVGSRAMTAYGEKVCAYLVRDLVQAGITIVSGLATGIDAIAHRTALNNHGKTIAVLGCGTSPTVLFPADHRQLAERIVVQGGLLISEYADQVRAQRHHFPARNRIIAGISLGTVVIEAAVKSGALITAHKALEANRDVFAVPGSIFSSRSGGVHALLQQGAIVVESATDILHQLNMATTTTSQVFQRTQQLTLEQQAIMQAIQAGYTTPEQLTEQLHYNAQTIIAYLTELEIQGIVRKNQNQHYEMIQYN